MQENCKKCFTKRSYLVCFVHLTDSKSNWAQIFNLFIQYNSFLTPFCPQLGLSRWRTRIIPFFNFFLNSFFHRKSAFIVIKSKSKLCNCATYISEFKLTFFAFKKIYHCFNCNPWDLQECQISFWNFVYL